MKNIAAIVLLITLITSGCSTTTTPIKTHPMDVALEARTLYNKLNLNGILPEKAFTEGYKVAMTSHFSNHKLAVVDFTKHSAAKRMFLFDLDKGELLLETYVAHGTKSGKAYANEFSNELGSNKSSLGHFVGNETYSGRNGYSLRIDGMTVGSNDNARRRYITFHSADYTSDDSIGVNKMLGRSNGCFAMQSSVSDYIIDELKGGGIVYTYHDGISR